MNDDAQRISDLAPDPPEGMETLLSIVSRRLAELEAERKKVDH
jgi:hypothetical protein